ncbi:MAG TPA: hypothetical protein DHW15_07025 [Bacteroidetes bacterium]|jgi:DNA polymerase III subunit delta'|nr:MAG: hypothetical protein ABR94_02995 [Sphingobacteriales bacterium BACL12 MAG-120802-bin5]KRP13382.1 MAG: hypothetical protein ABR95_12835 [Sphingobacteriales bacterium BACL12 MAG-120813-bin55]HCK21905.1 hypothetical protein [Bacteroidota bacterium]
MLFREVIGNEDLKKRLLSSIQEGRISHAQLFLGPEGCGNLPMALAYAQYLNCENRTPEDACGTCASCQKAQKFIHPDIHFTFPFIVAGDKKEDRREKCADWLPEWRQFLSENPYGNYQSWIRYSGNESKQGNINAKECHEIIHRLSFKTFESTYKILILWLPEFLEKEGNRLLKLIEEPPDNTVFLMVGHNPDRILNTILSRLQTVRFARLSDKDLASALEEKEGLTAASAQQIAILSNGNFSRAMELLHVADSGMTRELQQWLRWCNRPGRQEIFNWINDFVKQPKEQQKAFFNYGMHVGREVMLIQSGAQQLNRLTEGEIQLVTGLAKVLTPEATSQLIQLFDRYTYLIERNANSKIMMTQMSVTLMRLFRGVPASPLPAVFNDADM